MAQSPNDPIDISPDQLDPLMWSDLKNPSTVRVGNSESPIATEWKSRNYIPGTQGWMISSNGEHDGFSTVVGGSDTSATFIIGPSSNDDSADYDYTTDGTADNVQIQAAIDALPSTGGRIVLREGTYTLAATVTIAKNGVKLQGQGAGSIVTCGAVSNLVFLTCGHASTQYRDLFIQDLKFVQAATGSPRIIKNSTASGLAIANLIITRCIFEGGSGGQIIESDSESGLSGTQISYCYFQSTSTASMVDLGGSNTNTTSSVSNCFFYTTSTTTPIIEGSTLIFLRDSNIVLDSAYNTVAISMNSRSTVSSCNINVTGNAGASAIMVEGAHSVMATNITVQTGSDGDVNSIAVKDVTAVHGNQVFGFGIAVRVDETALDTMIIGNTLSGRGNIIYLTGGRSMISGNKIDDAPAADNTYSAILIDTSASDTVITGNCIGSITGGNDWAYGIRENDTSCDSVIVGNRIEAGECQTATISTQDSDSVSASNLEI